MPPDAPSRRRLLRAGAGSGWWLARRSALALRSAVAGALLALDVPLANAASILAVRVWPSRDYTRVTLELDRPLKSTQLQLSDPPRLVVDLDGLEIDLALRELIAKIRPEDPYIERVRIGQNQPTVARIVLDLKTPVAPQLFTLAPAGHYRHRLVLDLYPLVPIDPLKTLIDDVRERQMQSGQPTQLAQPSGDDALAGLLQQHREFPVERSPGAHDAAPTGFSSKRRAPSQPEVTRLVTIAIDPGHGGEDPGAIGRRGTREKDVVLRIAQRLRERINGDPNLRAFMIRDADFFVPLALRVAKARRVQADLFVSIHADAFVRPEARGASVYVLSERGASSTAARWLARKENDSDRIGGVPFRAKNRQARQVLLDMSTTAQIRHSATLGQIVLGELGDVGQLHKARIEEAGFAVLKAPDIPSILVETAFISNPQEERRLASSRYQARIADAIYRGLRAYLRKHPPPPKARTT